MALGGGGGPYACRVLSAITCHHTPLSPSPPCHPLPLPTHTHPTSSFPSGNPGCSARDPWALHGARSGPIRHPVLPVPMPLWVLLQWRGAHHVSPGPVRQRVHAGLERMLRAVLPRVCAPCQWDAARRVSLAASACRSLHSASFPASLPSFLPSFLQTSTKSRQAFIPCAAQ